MSFFVNLTKSIADFISKRLLPIKNSAIGAENAELSSGFSNWYFCRHKRKPNSLSLLRLSELEQQQDSPLPTPPSSSSLPLGGVDIRQSSLRLHSSDRGKGFNTAALLPNMCAALSKSHNSSFVSPHQHQIIRNKCGREECADPCHWPLCPPFNKRYPNDESTTHNIYEAYWDNKNDDCCEDECKWSLPHPRFDDMYSTESDKTERIYTRTWMECAPRIKPKPACTYDGIPPDFCLRPRKERPRTACPPADSSALSANAGKCPKIKMPCCGEARKKPKCRPLLRGPSNCKRFCTPYPAFSECKKPRARLPKSIECSCLNTVSTCEIYAYWRRRILDRAGKNC